MMIHALLVLFVSIPTLQASEVNSFNVGEIGNLKELRTVGEQKDDNRADVVLGTAYQPKGLDDSETASTFLYVLANQQNVATPVYTLGTYTTQYQAQTIYPSIDFNQMVARHLVSISSLSLKFGIGFGFGLLDGTTTNANFLLFGSGSKSQLYYANVTLGPKISFDVGSFFNPYIGAAGIALPYRQASSLPSLEKQGVGLGGTAFVGLDIPIYFLGRMTLNIEGRLIRQFSDTDHMLGMNGYGIAGGLGVFL